MGVALGQSDDLAVLPGSRPPLGPHRVVPRGRHGHSREEVLRVHRARLLDAFVEAVGEVGYEHTKIIDVCRRAGVSNRAFYDCSANKEECYLAAIDIGTRFLVEKVVRAFEAEQRAVAAPALRDGPREAVLVGAVVRPVFGSIAGGKTELLPDLAPSLVDFLALAVPGSEPSASPLEPA